MADSIRILGIDPGSRITGYGVVIATGSSVSYLASGCIRTGQRNFNERLQIIFADTREIIETHQPDEIAIERVFVAKNADSALKLGHARAAAICGTFGSTQGISEYSPREIKQAVTGSGGADKPQVQHMVMRLLGLEGKIQSDAADALAVSICHAHMRTVNHLTRTDAVRGVSG
ncbi:MAG: crossover junction endodeoxyribonuclease RuvC [Gammaproteobacteria bacterium]